MLPDGTVVSSFASVPDFYRSPKRPPQEIEQDVKKLSAWHQSWTHIVNLLVLRDEYLLVFMQDLTDRETKNLMDIYDREGNLLVGSVQTPLFGSRCSTQGDLLVTIRDNEPDENGNLPNPRILKYRLK